MVCLFLSFLFFFSDSLANQRKKGQKVLPDVENSIVGDVKADSSDSDAGLYFFLRANILKEILVASHDQENLMEMVDNFVSRFIIINGSVNRNFSKVPVFSIFNVLLYIRLRRERISNGIWEENGFSPFFDLFEDLIKSACLISKAKFSTNFERFLARFFWMRCMMTSSYDVRSFVQNLNSTPSNPTHSKFSVLFPSAQYFPEDLRHQPILLSPGEYIVESRNKITSKDLSAGNVIIPSEETNPGFDFMMMIQTPKDECHPSRNLLVLVECKHNNPGAQGSTLSLDSVNSKFKTLMQPPGKEGMVQYHKDGFFQLGSFQIPMKDVVYVLLSSHHQVPEISSVDVHGFPGIICFANHFSVQEMIGAPLANCGAVLIETRDLRRELEGLQTPKLF